MKRNLLLFLLAFVVGTFAMAQTTEFVKGYGQQREAAELDMNKPDVTDPYTGNQSGSRQGGDDIGSAFPIATLPFTDNGTTMGYTHDYNEVCPYTTAGSPDVVYSYTAATDDIIDIDMCGSAYDTKIYVYEDIYTPGSPYACNDDYYVFGDPCGQYVSAIFDMAVTAGNTYYIVVDGYGASSAGVYQILVEGAPPPPPVPANDLCENAEVVECGSSVSGTTLGATFDGVSLCDDVDNTAPGVWYTFKAYSPEYTLSLCSFANFDTKISVYTGDCDNLVCVGGNDDFCGLSSQVTVATEPLQTYYVLVHGYGIAQGDFTLDVTCGAPFPVPVSNWAILLGVLLIGTFVVVRYRRKLA